MIADPRRPLEEDSHNCSFVGIVDLQRGEVNGHEFLMFAPDLIRRSEAIATAEGRQREARG